VPFQAQLVHGHYACSLYMPHSLKYQNGFLQCNDIKLHFGYLAFLYCSVSWKGEFEFDITFIFNSVSPPQRSNLSPPPHCHEG
jgi:hypothetical protein